ncbi:ATP-binding protein [Comamonas serinivorans]|uniref:ATP-binding protein n=2 Tax=Comamonas serinivorans TaxID=1082851 RepID=A0A1Y0EQ75_9BURK|nr:ATP-binding protein [Comamonas serinivorans]
MITTLAIANYRSLRELVLPLEQLTVITGPNGSGKSSVYKALRLLADIASGGVVSSLVREGGLDSALWAGPGVVSARMKRGEVPVQGTVGGKPTRMKLGFAADDDGFGYAIALGSAAPSSVPKVFERDPEIKHEAVWAGPQPRAASLLVQREGPNLRVRDEAGRGWARVDRPVPGWASMMTEHADPRSAPEMLTVREHLRRWRFYDHFRSDADAPARQPRLGSFTPVLAADGADLAAAWASIHAIGDHDALAEAVDDAFAGATVTAELQGERFALQMRQPGLLRPLQMAELSDGTLRYLLWVAALLTPRPPPLLVLNEPETSLHPDLLPALGRLIARAAAQTQVVVVSHANRLLAALEAAAPESGYLPLHLDKQLGETVVANLRADELPRWSWLD